jgi:phage terminase small subunit
MDNLTDKQKRFIEEYLVDLNATQAAIRAGYSEKTAYSIGEENLRKPEIASAINKAMARLSKRTEITQEKVLQQLAKIAFADIKDVLEFGPVEKIEDVDENGHPITKIKSAVLIKPSSEVDGTVIAEVSETRDGIRVKRNDQVKALELLGRHLGMFNDKLEISGVKTVVIHDDLPEDK